MTDIHWSDAEIDRLWESLASGTTSDHPPSEYGWEPLRRLYERTQDAPPAHVRRAVDRAVRPLMDQERAQPTRQAGAWNPVQSVVPNRMRALPRPVVHGDRPRFLMVSPAIAVSLVVVLLLLTGGAGFYLLSDRAEREPPPIPAAVYQQPAASPQSSPLAALVWESNTDVDPILEPNDVTIAPDGNIWVADGIASNFKILGRDGALLETWGESGKDPGQFNFMANGSDGAAAFDAEGNLYVADTGNFRIQKFDQDRAFITSWGRQGAGAGAFLAASDIEIDDRGRVFVADLEQNTIQAFDSDGKFLFRFGRQGNAEGEFNQPVDLAFDPDGRLWVADSGNNRIQVFGVDGSFLAAFGSFGSESGQMMVPHGIDIDAEGHIYVAELYGYRVQILNSDGESLGIFGAWSTVGDGFEQLEDIAVDEDGGMYISDVMENRVQKFQLGALPETPSGT